MTLDHRTVSLADVVAALVDGDHAIIELARDGTIARWTRSAERIYGYVAEDMVGRSLSEFVPAEFAGAERRWLERVLAEGRSIRVETERHGNDGVRRVVSLNLIPLRDERTMIVGAVAIERELARDAPAETIAEPASVSPVKPPEIFDVPVEKKRVESLGPYRAMYRTPSGRSETILVVDDDPLVLGAICQSLKRSGYVVIGAVNGAEALRAVEECDRPIDLMLSDITMPEMNGRALFAQMRTYYPGVRFIFMSGTEPGDAIPDPFDGRPAHFLAKPITNHVLLTEVRRVLDESRAD